MKVLFVDHPEADFLAALLYLGLYQELGADNVVEYPWKGSYHGQIDHYRLPAQAVWGVDGSISASYKDGTTAPFVWMPTLPSLRRSLDEICASIGSFGLVVCSVRQFARDALSQIIGRVGRGALPPVVVFDGDDTAGVKDDVVGQFEPKVYFKRHLLQAWSDTVRSARIRPLPFATAQLFDRVEPGAPLVDVALLGGSNVPNGKGAYEEAIRRVTSNYIFGQLDYKGMIEAVRHARVAVAPRGMGQDTLRSWEFLGVEGPLVFVHRHALQQPYPLVDGQHVVYFDKPDELELLLGYYLGDEKRRQEIARAGFEFTKQHHTAQARARYLIEEALR